MCGIFGFYSPRHPRALTGIEAAQDMLTHRGPDDEGYVCLAGNVLMACKGKASINELAGAPRLESVGDSELVLGHKRLSILDLSAAGHQPMLDQSKRYALVFNGEIFNYIELRQTLESLGIIFKSNSDTEVVLQALITWGVAAFSKFNGMWAVAFFDLQMRTLLLCRDRFGVKPLFYSCQNNAIYFSSEMKAIHAIPGLKFDININSINDYTENCYLNTGSQTFWNQINEIEPGSWLLYDTDCRVSEGSYWDFTPSEKVWTLEHALEKFSELFEDSLRLRMRSDVEVGTLLSGGLDSNAIVCALHKFGLISPEKFKSFSAIFDDAKFSEEAYIHETLKQVPLDSYFVKPTPEGFEEDLNSLLYHIEEPFRSASVYSQYKIYQTMKLNTKVKVVLNGQGADELFSGYTAAYYRLFAHHFWRGNFGEMISEVMFFSRNRSPSPLRLIKNTLKQIVRAAGRSSYFAQEQFSEVKFSALREYLKYDDRTSMSASIEARTPFLDYRLVEFAFTLPAYLKIQGGSNKVLEREFCTGLVPDVITNRKDKMGFVSPQEVWQRNELAPLFEKTFSEMYVLEPFMSIKHAVNNYDGYRKGRHQNWTRVWRDFCLARWMFLQGYGK